MSKVQWTDAQKNAIDARGGPLIVSAAAGSGKTAVLVQRIIDIVTDPDSPTDIDRFLVVTFTKAAAGEMKQRISKAISEKLKDDPFNKRLIEQQLLLPKAQISTIDSFCTSLTKEYFYMLDLPSDYRIIDEDEKEVLLNTALDTVLDTMYDSADEGFMQLSEAFSDAHDDLTLRSMVLKIHRFLEAQPFPKSWAEKVIDNYDVSDVSSPWKTVWGEALAQYTVKALSFVSAQANKAYELAHDEPLFEKAQDITDNECGCIEQLILSVNDGEWDNTCRLIAELKELLKEKLSFKGATKEPQKSVSKEIRACRKSYAAVVRKELDPLFRRTSAEFFEEIEKLRPMVSSLLKLTLLFSDEFQKLKAERSAGDFSDVEHWALELLVRETEDGFELTDEAREIAKRYDYVMVDEYQDANEVQDIIFKAVSDEDRHLFVVGDVKQSIYGFRLAMPEIFIRRKDESRPYDRACESYPAKVNLDANFRSRSGVTDAVNFIFRNIMSRDVGGVDYTKDEELVPKAGYPEEAVPAASFHLIGTGIGTADENTVIEAQYVGKLIKKMMAAQTVTQRDGTKRKPLWSDFCILMRSDTKYASVYIDELSKLGVPAVSNKGSDFFSRPEIRLMLSLLRAIDNPARDVPLAAVLLSPLAGFTADELALLKADKKGVSLYEILLSQSGSNEKAARVTEMFSHMRSLGNNISADELIKRIYNETLLPEIVLAGEDGEYRRKNLRLLLEYAKTYESSGFKGLSGFIGFLERLSENGRSLATASRTSGEKSDCVSIMSIHGSKGLEFPFCIVSQLGSKFNTNDMSDKVILHSKIGPGMNVVDTEKMFGYKGITRRAIEKSMESSLVSEELRILYVAMTRAKERLILTAAVSDASKTIQKAAEALVYDGAVAPYLVMSSSGFLNILLCCLLVCRSGGKLRDISGISAIPTDNFDNSLWDIVVTEADKTEDYGETAEEADTICTEEAFAKEDVSEEYKKIASRLSRRYPYAKECSIGMKVAASAVAEKESGETFAAQAKPSFMRSGSLSGAERGTALHAFAQYCDFKKARLDISAEKDRLVSLNKLTKEQADCIRNEKLERFLSSPLMEEMLAAQMIEREYTFMTEIPAGLADKTLIEPYACAKMILQGSIDCLYELDGELVIVDYKTDYVKSPEELKERYTRQLELYKYAAEQIFGKEVDRCVLYSFSLGEEIEVDLD